MYTMDVSQKVVVKASVLDKLSLINHDSSLSDSGLEVLFIKDGDSEKNLHMLFEDLQNHVYCALDIETYPQLYYLINNLESDELHEKAGIDPTMSAIRFIQLYPFHRYDSYINKSPSNRVYIIDFPSLENWAINNSSNIIEDLKKYLFIQDVTWVGHNIKFDIKHLLYNGFDFSEPYIIDTMLMHKVITAGDLNFYNASLKDLCKSILNIDLDKTYQAQDWSPEISIDNILSNDAMFEYLFLDVFVLKYIYDYLSNLCVSDKLSRVVSMEGHCSLVVAEMELAGMHIDLEHLANLKQDYFSMLRSSASSLISQIPLDISPVSIKVLLDSNMNPKVKIERIPLNLNSNYQVLKVLRHLKVMDPVDSSKLIESTGKDVIDQLDSSLYSEEIGMFIDNLKNYRKISKMINTYILPIEKKFNPKTNRLHSELNQLDAETGRFTSRDPNIQNIPRDHSFRSLFKPEKGNKYIIADFSQIEVRIVAALSKDQELIKAYNTGTDIYKKTASFIYNIPYDQVDKKTRQICKAVVLGFQYGMGAEKFMKYYNGNSAKSSSQDKISLETSKMLRSKFFQLYSGINNWHKEASSKIKNAGVKLESRTLINRRRIFRQNKYGTISYSSYINAPVQGTSADITKYSLILLREYFNLFYKKDLKRMKFSDGFSPKTDVFIVNTVHDEIVLECRDDLVGEVMPVSKMLMEYAGNSILKTVPVEVEISCGDSWADKN